MLREIGLLHARSLADAERHEDRPRSPEEVATLSLWGAPVTDADGWTAAKISARDADDRAATVDVICHTVG